MSYDQKRLYVCSTRFYAERAAEAITPEMGLAGWRPHSEKPKLIVNEGDEAGRLRSLTAPHKLTFYPQSGDQIVAALGVNVLRHWGGAIVWAQASRACYGQDGQEWHAQADTVLGRPVMLGEDGAEDAFGHCAIAVALEKLLAGDFSSTWCEVRFTEPNFESKYVTIGSRRPQKSGLTFTAAFLRSATDRVKIRRSHWPQGKAVKVVDEDGVPVLKKCLNMHEPADMPPDFSAVPLADLGQDIYATDWEVA